MSNAIIPTYLGSYNGDMIYSVTNYAVSDSIFNSVEKMDIEYESHIDYIETGYDTTWYYLSDNKIENRIGTIVLTLVGSLDSSIMFQLVQLSKAVISGGMVLKLYDNYITDTTYLCRWDNAGDFVENDELLCGGIMVLRFYKSWKNNVINEFESGIMEFESGIMEF